MSSRKSSARVISMAVSNSIAKPLQMSKYRLSRKGKKLQVCDDQRTLLALPKDVPERIWAEILLKEENDMVCFEIREDIIDEALRIGYEHYMERQTAKFTAHCAALAWLKLIDWHFYRHDPGEEPSAYPPCYIPKRAESWVPDQMPPPSVKDSFCKQRLNVVEECQTEVLPKWPTSDSLEYPAVDHIPKEYWFPGKIGYQILGRRVDKSTSFHDVHRRVPAGEAGAGLVSSEPSSEDIGGESEVLQKVTDYTTEPLAKESTTSALKTTTPVDGSLHGAGDSTVGRVQRKRSQRRFTDKSRQGFSRQSFGAKSKGKLPPLDGGDSMTPVSIISDCRLRNLRLDTHFEVSHEKIDTPPTEAVKRK